MNTDTSENSDAQNKVEQTSEKEGEDFLDYTKEFEKSTRSFVDYLMIFFKKILLFGKVCMEKFSLYFPKVKRFVLFLYTVFLDNLQLIKVSVILLVIIFISTPLLIHFYKQSPGSLADEPIKANILKGESSFVFQDYKTSTKAYKNVVESLKDSTPQFIKERLRISQYFVEMDEALKRGRFSQVKAIINKASKEKWNIASKTIFDIHFIGILPRVNRINQYSKNIHTIIQYLKNGKRKESKKFLKQAFYMAKKYNTDILPLTEKIIIGIQNSIPSMLLTAWEYRKELKLTSKDICLSLGKDNASQLKRAVLLLRGDDLEVAEVLSKLLQEADKDKLAQQYLSSISGNMEKKRRRIKIALILNPSFSEAYFQSAKLYRYRGNAKKALENYDNARKTYIARILDAKGWCYWQEYDIIQAVKNWKESLKSWPDYSNSHLGLAIFYITIQNTKKAKYHIDKLLLNQSQMGEILRALLRKDYIFVEKKVIPINNSIKGYLLLCYSIILKMDNQFEKALTILERAQTVFSRYNIKSLEIYSYKAALYKKLNNLDKEQQYLKKLFKVKDKNIAHFCSMIQVKNDKELFKKVFMELSKPWRLFWKFVNEVPENNPK